MNHSNAFSHLTLEERRIILAGISNGSTKSAIVKTIGKDQVILKPYLLKNRSNINTKRKQQAAVRTTT